MLKGPATSYQQVTGKLNYVFWKKAAQTVLERLVIEHTEAADN